jgi:hypothetical protein
MRQTRNKKTSECRGGNCENAFDQCLKKVFGITALLSNKAFVACFWFLITFVIFLGLWKATGFSWTRYAGIASLMSSAMSIAVAFSAQSSSQVIRFTSFLKTKILRSKPLVFKEEIPDFTKPVRKCFQAAKNFKNTSIFCVATRSIRRITIKIRTRNHARSYRKVARPEFARAASSSGDGGSDDGSGNSDLGEPPERQNPVTPSDSSEQPNKQNHPWRSPGRFRMSRRSKRGRFA